MLTFCFLVKMLRSDIFPLLPRNVHTRLSEIQRSHVTDKHPGFDALPTGRQTPFMLEGTIWRNQGSCGVVTTPIAMSYCLWRDWLSLRCWPSAGECPQRSRGLRAPGLAQGTTLTALPLHQNWDFFREKSTAPGRAHSDGEPPWGCWHRLVCLPMAKAELTLSWGHSRDPLPCLQPVPFGYRALAT